MSFEGCCAIFVVETRDVIMTKVADDWYRILYISIDSKIDADFYSITMYIRNFYLLCLKKEKKQRSLGTIYELPSMIFRINPRLMVFKFVLLNLVIFFCCISICKSQPLMHSPHYHNLDSFNIILIWEMGKTV